MLNQVPAHHQHRHRVHASVLHGPVLHKVPQECKSPPPPTPSHQPALQFLTSCVRLRQVISPAALFLAAKVEEQPRKLEHVIKVAHACLNPQEPSPDIRSDVSDFFLGGGIVPALSLF